MNNRLKVGLASLAIGMGAYVGHVNAVTEIQHSESCSTEILLSYFPEQFVSVTLEKFKIPEAQRAAIKSELAGKNQEVITTVEERSAKMSPNPLRDPQHRQEAVKIFRDTLYDLFAGVMEKHGVHDKQQIQSMLDDVQQQKAKYFAKCMEKVPSGSLPSQSSQNAGKSPTSERQPFSRKPKGPSSN